MNLIDMKNIIGAWQICFVWEMIIIKTWNLCFSDFLLPMIRKTESKTIGNDHTRHQFKIIFQEINQRDTRNCQWRYHLYYSGMLFYCIFTILMKWIKISSTHCYEWQSSLHEINQIRKNRIFMFAIKYDKRDFFFFFLTFQWKCSTSDSYSQLEYSIRDWFVTKDSRPSFVEIIIKTCQKWTL